MALLLRKIIDNASSQEEGISEREMLANFETIIGQERFKDLMIEKLANVLIALFRSLHDLNFEIPAKSILSSPAPFRSDERQVLEAIDYLQVRMSCKFEKKKKNDWSMKNLNCLVDFNETWFAVDRVCFLFLSRPLAENFSAVVHRRCECFDVGNQVIFSTRVIVYCVMKILKICLSLGWKRFKNMCYFVNFYYRIMTN